MRRSWQRPTVWPGTLAGIELEPIVQTWRLCYLVIMKICNLSNSVIKFRLRHESMKLSRYHWPPEDTFVIKAKKVSSKSALTDDLMGCCLVWWFTGTRWPKPYRKTQSERERACLTSPINHRCTMMDWEGPSAGPNANVFVQYTHNDGASPGGHFPPRGLMLRVEWGENGTSYFFKLLLTFGKCTNNSRWAQIYLKM